MVGQMSAPFESEIKIKSNLYEYGITFAKLSELSADSNQILIIDSSLREKTLEFQSKFAGVIEIEANENNKNLENCAEILEKIALFGARRSTRLVAVGGGVVQDVVTLSASLYMRGLSWTFYPSTLMSIMDSCIGGKSSINFRGYKNILGNFYPPQVIVIDTSFVHSLPPRAISSGIAEGMKIVFAKGEKEFKLFKEAIESWRFMNDDDSLRAAVRLSLNSKKWFIETDEFDRNERKLLNFGHSFGHALEAATEFQVPHGMAILFGMRAAIYEAGQDEKCRELREMIEKELQHSQFLSHKIKLKMQKFKDSLAKDKKNSNDRQVLVLPNENGKLEIVSRELSEANIESCWQSIVKSLEDSGASYEIC